MGQSTDAYLMYGFDLSDELELIDEEGDSLYDWEACETISKMLKPYNLTLVQHCSSDYPMWILAYEPSFCSANRGYPTHINLDDYVKLEKAARVQFKRFFAENDWVKEYNFQESEADWWLASNWG